MSHAGAKVIGLTGLYASGKSHILKLFEGEGCAVADSDKFTHELLAAEAAELVSKEFSQAVENGEVNRKKLGEIVFNDEQKLKALEDILHPMVRAKNQEFIDANQGKVVVLEIPLLFETEAEKICDYTISVNISAETLKKRAEERGTFTEKLEKILSHQMLQEEKNKRADFVIDNDDGDDTLAQVREILEKITNN